MVEYFPISAPVTGSLSGSVLNGWCTRQGHASVLFIAHGNGFSTRVYQPLLDKLAVKYDLLMFDLPGHGQSPDSEVTDHSQTAEYLYEAIRHSESYIAGRDVHAVAHSLGGMLSVFVASKHPETFKSLVLLDPIMFPQPLLSLMHVMSKLGMTKLFHPHVKPTLRRRNGWPDRQSAFEYFYKRKIFKYWTDQALRSYTDYALKEHDSQVVLCCDPTLEARWFATLPSKLWHAVASIRCPVTIYLGEDTYSFSPRAAKQACRKNARIGYSVVPGGHCFMQEFPEQAAGHVFAALGKGSSLMVGST